MLERDCQHGTVGVIYSWIADQTRAKVEHQRGRDRERHNENNSRPGRVVVLLQFHQKNVFWRIRWAIFVYFKALTSKASWKPQYVPNLSVWQTRRNNGSRRRRRRRSSGEKKRKDKQTQRKEKTEERTDLWQNCTDESCTGYDRIWCSAMTSWIWVRHTPSS